MSSSWMTIGALSCPPLLVGEGSGVTMTEGVRVGVWSDSLIVDSELVNESTGVVSSGRGLEEAAAQRGNTLNKLNLMKTTTHCT